MNCRGSSDAPDFIYLFIHLHYFIFIQSHCCLQLKRYSVFFLNSIDLNFNTVTSKVVHTCKRDIFYHFVHCSRQI